MGGKSGAPQAPDYSALLSQQTAANTAATNAATVANRPNVTTPTGSTTWSQSADPFNAQYYLQANPDVAAAAANPAVNGGMTPEEYAQYHYNSFGQTEGRAYDAAGDKGAIPAQTWSEVQSLTPAEQALLTQQQGTQLAQGNAANTALGQATTSLSTPQNFASELPGWQNIAAPQAGQVSYNANTANDVSNALYNESTQYLDPQWDQAQRQNDAKLSASGLSTDSDAYTSAESNFGLGKQKAYTDARNQAISGGETAATQELQNALAAQGQNFSQQLSSANFQDQTQQDALQAALQSIGVQSSDRDSSLNDYLKLMGMGGSTGSNYTAPSFGSGGTSTTAGTTDPGDITSANNSQYQAALNSVNASNANAASETGAGVGLVGALASSYSSWGPYLASLFA